MSTLRRWQLNSTRPLSLELAADARLSRTDYTDDQVWQLSLGALESPALALQTHYGGRVGLASLVPMWVIEGRTIYQAQAYAKPPVVTAFAPAYLQVQGNITPRLALRAEYWAMDSHAIGGRFSLGSTENKPFTVRLDLFGHVGASGKELPLSLLPLGAHGHALSMGQVGNIRPVVAMQNAHAAPDSPGSPKISATVTIPAGGKVSIVWVHAGLPDVTDSLALAHRWLAQSWSSSIKQVTQAAQAIPIVETGDEDLDAAIAFAYRSLVQSYLKPSASLPHASFVAARQPDRGFSARGDGTDHIRAWSGQAPTLAYLASLGIAPIDPELAQGVLLNYLAIQQDDGWIDWKPGLAGQRQGVLCLPILARLAWGIFQYTEDDAFLSESFPALLKFFERWFAQDGDGDGLPEWQAETQTGYPYFPTFALSMPWGQHAEIRTVETPDLAAYLLSEAISLRQIAYYLRDDANAQKLAARVETLKAALDSFWRDGRYAYRDRDTHETIASVVVLADGSGDEQHFPALKLAPANRLIVRVTGGLEHTPAMTLHLEGLDANGQPLVETAASDAFVWTHGRGVYTSQRGFSQIDRVWFDGLIRVYRVNVTTLDTTRLDINAALPLWSVGLPPERAAELVSLLSNPDHFLRPNGVTMASAQDAEFDPANANGAGGIWPFWLTLIGEGLIETGQDALAADVLRRLLRVQVAGLTSQKAFSEFYHSDELRGLGERGNLGGIVPLHLLLRVLGIRVISAGKVWTGGSFGWASPVTLRQHGVTVTRSTDGTRIAFPSGHTVELPASAVWQDVIDPNVPPPTPRSSARVSAQDDLFDDIP